MGLHRTEHRLCRIVRILCAFGGDQILMERDQRAGVAALKKETPRNENSRFRGNPSGQFYSPNDLVRKRRLMHMGQAFHHGNPQGQDLVARMH